MLQIFIISRLLLLEKLLLNEQLLQIVNLLIKSNFKLLKQKSAQFSSILIFVNIHFTNHNQNKQKRKNNKR